MNTRNGKAKVNGPKMTGTFSIGLLTAATADPE
jgi:hypothetical protein